MQPPRRVAPKYNPAFLTDDERVASFCVRKAEFDSIVDMLRDCTGPSNAHQLVIGPRGSGKTTLLLRVAAEVRRAPGLSADLFPVTFSEESYGVSTAGEFWLEALERLLEALERLADQAPSDPDGPDLRASLREIRKVRSDPELGARSLGALLDFADRAPKQRLVLIVENLHRIFDDMTDEEAGWRLRNILQTEPRIILLCSAVTRFSEITDPGRALYEQFRIVPLERLEEEESRVLWEAESGRKAPGPSIRPLQILTGGSPRLLAILARFGANRSISGLISNLQELVDDHTEYFRSHIEALPAQERRVFLALAELWRPSTTREIADRSRLDTNRCSAQLQRLMKRGVVASAGGSPRRKMYVLTERLYNIYYLLRVRGGNASLVRALVRFMRAIYSPRELEEMRAELRSSERDADWAIASMAKAIHAQLEAADEDSAEEAVTLFNRGLALAESGSLRQAVALWRNLVERFGESDVRAVRGAVAAALDQLVVVLGTLGRFEEAVAAADEMLVRFAGPQPAALLRFIARGVANRGTALAEAGRLSEAIDAWDEMSSRFEGDTESDVVAAVALAGVNKAGALRVQDRPVEAIAVLDSVVERFGTNEEIAVIRQVATGLVNKGNLLRELDRLDDAVAACREVVRRFGDAEDPELRVQTAKALVNKGTVLAALERYEEALAAWADCVSFGERDQTPEILVGVGQALCNRAVVLNRRGEWAQAAAVADDIERRFGDRRTVPLRGIAALGLIQKGVALTRMTRTAEALSVYEELLLRFDDSPELALYTQHARIQQATLRLSQGERHLAIEIASTVLREEAARDFRWLALAVRARAAAPGDPAGAARDVRELLDMLAEGDPPSDAISMLLHLSLSLGPQEMLRLVEASTAREFLLPLRAALEMDLGRSPRVPVEVEEVARDLRRALVERRAAEDAARPAARQGGIGDA